MAKTIIMDISHHQKSNEINWAQAAKELAFVIIRVQYGSNLIDEEYKKHVENCKKYGIPFGHYAYGMFVSVSDAIVEAQDFMKRADKDALFLALDVEHHTVNAFRKKSNLNDLGKASQAFIDTLKKAGHKTGYYVSHDLHDVYGLNKVKADFKWLPRYGTDNGKPQTKPAYACDLWQYSQFCKVSWYAKNLDLNLLNSSKTIDWYLGVNTEKADISKEVTKMPERDINKVSSWASKEWEYVTENGYFDGSRPGSNITREESGIVTKRIIDNIREYIVEPLQDRIKKLEDQVKELKKKE